MSDHIERTQRKSANKHSRKLEKINIETMSKVENIPEDEIEKAFSVPEKVKNIGIKEKNKMKDYQKAKDKKDTKAIREALRTETNLGFAHMLIRSLALIGYQKPAMS